MELVNQHAHVRIVPTRGGRLASLRVFGRELLVTAADDPLHWGCYPMAPWAGRVRHGRFTHEGRDFQLPVNLPPHAIHGTVLDRPWTQTSENTLDIALGPDWPFAGYAQQRFSLDDDSLHLELSVHADGAAFPSSIGWHPWFRRTLDSGEAAVLQFDAAAMYADDAEQIPSGELVEAPPGPWDNCFTALRSGPRIRWGGALELTLSSNFDHWVVYDQPAHALCVEPMSGPPDALNLRPLQVTPSRPLRGTFTLAWKKDNAR